MPVNSTHPQYAHHSERWERVRSVIDSEVQKFIKTIDVNDSARDKQYRDDAILTNFTLRTRNALVGSVFRLPATVDLPRELEYLVPDATGDMLTLEQLAQTITSDVIEVGRAGFLVDYPTAVEGLTEAEVEELALSARIKPYKAETIINWSVKQIGSIAKVDMIVLLEASQELGEDGFTWEAAVQYRVLRLVEGVYTQIVMNDEDEIISAVQPRRNDGTTFDTIPFVFIGSENNDPQVDSAPLYDMSNINIGHYKNSADYEESVHITGQPTLFMSSAFSADDFAEANPNGVKIGARRGHNVGEGGSAMLLQAAPNQLADEAMKRKEQQAVMTGARLIMPQSGVETAEAAMLRASSESSVLNIIVNNVEAGLVKALEISTQFMGGNPEEIEYKLNREFFDNRMDPQELMAQIQTLDRQIISTKDLRANMRRAGLIAADRTDEDIDEDLGDMDPLA